jgi:cohesin loading factor subunit SCC2
MHTVFQGSLPSLSYPTPPPGMATSSSSLALALGEPTLRPSHEARQSRKFFGDFLSKKIRETDTHPGLSPYHPDPPHGKSETVSSKNLDAHAANSPSEQPAHTPRKRKPIVQLESPSVKRFQPTPRGSTMQSDVFSPSHISSAIASPTKKVAYVEIPPSPWLTPSSSSKRVAQEAVRRVQNKMNVKSHDGYGSDYSPAIHSEALKSSARRTGDRDDRGLRIFIHTEHKLTRGP